MDKLLDFIFNTYDELLLNGEYTAVDSMLKLDVSRLPIDVLVGILTITSLWKKQLVNRDIFYTNVENYILLSHNKEETHSILNGLE